MDLSDPIATTLAVGDAFREAGIEAALYGGLALAVYGEPRETKDTDLAVAGATAAEGAAALQRAGLQVAVAFEHVELGGAWVTRITLLGGGDASGLNTADLVEPRSPRYARAALRRAIGGKLRGRDVAVVAPEDFVVFKALATRERDILDAATVIRALGTSLDVDQIRREAQLLAAEIPDWAILDRLRRIEEAARTDP